MEIVAIDEGGEPVFGCAGGRLRLLVGEFERVTEVLGNLRRAFTAYKGGNAVVQLASVTAASLITRSYSSTPIPDGLHSLPTPHPCLYPYVSVQARRTCWSSSTRAFT